MPKPFTTWSQTMRKLVAVCRRPDSEWADDLIGVVGLFLLVFLTLSYAGPQ
ncbi:MAG: hypothetical protein HC783_13285 [Rhodobacteraceae bacterium]|nr:hypothetical protein [Paracoccaceae bacterium]